MKTELLSDPLKIFQAKSPHSLSLLFSGLSYSLRQRVGGKSLESFVSHNYSPIIWSKYYITEHFVVQAAWL